MKYIVATLGFLLVTVVVYFLTVLVLVIWSSQFLVDNFPITVQGMNNPIGVVLALLAGASSFRASLKANTKSAQTDTEQEPQ